MKTWFNSIVPLALVVLALGCESAPTASPVRPPPPPPDIPVAAPAEAASPVVFQYTYNPTALRDPFRPPEEARQQRLAEGMGQCTEPLCQWDLDQLDLKAVVTGDSSPFGMVVDPKGRGYIVRRSTRIGRQGGQVTQVLRDQITITEYWTRPDGKRDQLSKQLRLASDRGFVPAQDLVTGKTYE